ncbi:MULTISPECIES: heme exporter protein CcmB [unclassified Bradyrhizobium]|uniref:heme exporter protein CcmB n=2 Tax=unclassified Bradyrhizobium TaxID=2631580 RepID=UPI001FFC1EAB|nr:MULTISPECIES: heme exporter protein CcmB [unclassified Bradyrhizobium]MCK1331326.1 heme exporter protein CcmB [Bradyrhizobium sp. CW9]MCK1411580.1 heme exporter protein CcmB [Bradyrhizobium sp. CW4]MCK1428680.1 heme exporter protein CcmB [Bradyrhizobium sp. 87]MCK1519591.1 heme exporter protein CcmB [Bradyrhizobium sp. 17]MCK1538320.1 heme exporter protein CcmB [Bradyrhizobium sp. 176]
MIRILLVVFLRDVTLARRIGGGGVLGLVFFLSLVTVVPFAIGPDLRLLSRIGPAILWIAALLASLLGLDRLFQADHEDGSLDQMLLSPTPLELIVLVKCMAHWFVTGLPLVLLSPLFGLMLDLDGSALWAVAATLLVGTPTFTFLGAIGAALTVTLRRGGLLLSILVVPLAVPVLIFGVSAAQSGTAPVLTPFLVLCALGLASVALAPIAAAAALRGAGE